MKKLSKFLKNTFKNTVRNSYWVKAYREHCAGWYICLFSYLGLNIITLYAHSNEPSALGDYLIVVLIIIALPIIYVTYAFFDLVKNGAKWRKEYDNYKNRHLW